MKAVMRVAVIGAGAAGLSALKLLSCSSHSPTTFKVTAYEQTSNVGGTWLYTECIGTDDLGLPVHSSMYKNLRTNLPKELMAYPDHSFPDHLPSFVSHQDVQTYLEDYATAYGLWKLIKFKTIVEAVKPIPDKDNRFGVRWQVTTADVLDRQNKQTDLFDAVLVCNGHFAKPLTPEIPGLDQFEGTVVHSHDYREPHPYADKTVVVLGAQSSGQDISVEVSSVAKWVYLSHNKARLTTFLPANLEQRSGIKSCHRNGVEFHDGSTADVDVIILCTGYHYVFDFLDDSVGVKVDDGRITSLYKHFLSPTFPSLALVGLLTTVVPFPLFYMQIQYFRSILDGTADLPSEKEMKEEEEEEFQKLKLEGKPARYVHAIREKQFCYMNHLADLGHFEHLSPALEKLYTRSLVYRKENVTTYRNLNFTVVDEDGDIQVVVK